MFTGCDDILPTLLNLIIIDDDSVMPVLENPKEKVKEVAFILYHNAESLITGTLEEMSQMLLDMKESMPNNF